MNKVKERCLQDKHAKFYYASNRIFTELKIIKVVLYFLAMVPVILSFIPQVKEEYSLISSLVSFSLTIITECATSFLNKHKDTGIHSLQLYETGVTGSTLSKIEYDRELTNDLNELAIRKGLSRIKNLKDEKKHEIYVPAEIPDDYSYLYICRINAATNKYLLSRIFYIYFFFLALVIAVFAGAVFYNPETAQYLTLIIAFYPLVSPIIKDCNAAKECMRDCTKLCADIDNFFADGDSSLERLARMLYYVQQLEYDMYQSRPTVFKTFKKIFKKGTDVLQAGVTERFFAAIVELKQKSLINKGLISLPKGKSLITQKEYDIEQLKRIEKEKKAAKVSKPQPDKKPVKDEPQKQQKPVGKKPKTEQKKKRENKNNPQSQSRKK